MEQMTDEQRDLVENHIKYARKCVHNNGLYRNVHHSTEDVYSMAYMALCKAAMKYTPERGPYLPFAKRVILTEIVKELRHNNRHSPYSDCRLQDKVKNQAKDSNSDTTYEHFLEGNNNIEEWEEREEGLFLMRIMEEVLQRVPEKWAQVYRGCIIQGGGQENVGKEFGYHQVIVSRIVSKVNAMIHTVYDGRRHEAFMKRREPDRSKQSNRRCYNCINWQNETTCALSGQAKERWRSCLNFGWKN